MLDEGRLTPGDEKRSVRLLKEDVSWTIPRIGLDVSAHGSGNRYLSGLKGRSSLFSGGFY